MNLSAPFIRRPVATVLLTFAMALHWPAAQDAGGRRAHRGRADGAAGGRGHGVDRRAVLHLVPGAGREMNAAPLLETRALTVRAAGRSLVDGLAWRVNAGERWCVIGRNGAGKSLVLRALAGLGVPQRSGEVLWQCRAQHRIERPSAPVGRHRVQFNFAMSTIRSNDAHAGILLSRTDRKIYPPLAERRRLYADSGRRAADRD